MLKNIKEASFRVGLKRNAVSQAIRGNFRAVGFHWAYVEKEKEQSIEKEKTYKIYYIVINNEYYIGYTGNSLLQRIGEHIHESLKNKPTKANLAFRNIVLKGVCPHIYLLRDGISTVKEAQDYEKYYIKEYKERGYVLLNSTNIKFD